MRIHLWPILILLVAGPRPAYSELVIIPLSQLQGLYASPEGVIRSTEFFLPSQPTSITAVRMAIYGELQAGRVYCDYSVYRIGMQYSVVMADSASGGEWMVTLYSGYTSGSFFDRAELEPANHATWDCLMDRQGEISIHGYPVEAAPECSAEEMPSSTLDAVELIVEGVFATPVEQTTWSRIKALYR